MSRIYVITNKRENSILVPIPASIRWKKQSTIFYLLLSLSERTSIQNGFKAIEIKEDRDELKGTRNTDKIFNLRFDASLFKDKQVILLDDVLNTGEGFIQIKENY